MVEQLNKNVEALNIEKSKLKEELDKSKNEISTLEQTSKENISRIDILSGSISFLEKDLELAKTRNGLYSKEIEEKESKINSLYKEVSEYKENNEKYTEDNNKLTEINKF